jgi:hypothetical protein
LEDEKNLEDGWRLGLASSFGIDLGGGVLQKLLAGILIALVSKYLL